MAPGAVGDGHRRDAAREQRGQRAPALHDGEALDAEDLFRTVREKSISMCGFLPATTLLFTARALGAARAEVVSRRDSGDETGDTSSVVGYAGVVVT